MKTILASNIRKLRKERKLTQEQLANAMNVTTGAVYKWEQELSIPDLNTIMDLARFFSLSVDALIGYDAMNQSISGMINTIKTMENKKEYDKAISLADKLIVLYPNNYEVLFNCGLLYEHCVFEKEIEGINRKRDEYIEKSLNCLFKAKDIIKESKSPNLDLYYLDSCIADCYCAKKDFEKAIEILKLNNYEGINDSRISEILIFMDNKNDQEIKKYVSHSLVSNANSMLNSLIMAFRYCDLVKDTNKIKFIIDYMLNFIESLQSKDGKCYMNKCLGYLYFRKAVILNEEKKDYYYTLVKAYYEVVAYDSVEYYTNDDIILSFLNVETLRMIDDIGKSSICLIDEFIEKNELDEEFLNKWRLIVNG